MACEKQNSFLTDSKLLDSSFLVSTGRVTSSAALRLFSFAILLSMVHIQKAYSIPSE